jgi:LysM repeat protein
LLQRIKAFLFQSSFIPATIAFLLLGGVGAILLDNVGQFSKHTTPNSTPRPVATMNYADTPVPVAFASTGIFVASDTPPALIGADGNIVHTIASGETLYGIATRYGITVEELSAINNISDASLVMAGQTLVIPASSATQAANASITLPPTLTPDFTDAPTLIPTSTEPTTATPTFSLPVPTAIPAGVTPLVAVTSTMTPLPVTGTPFNAPPAPDQVNGILIDTIAPMPPDVRKRVQQIYDLGRIIGRNPHAFSKVGDSVIENPHFLARFDDRDYNLGAYAYLQPVIDFYAGSFGRQGVAVQRGMHSWSVFDPFWASSTSCIPNETVIACEFRLNNPTVVFIRLGSNDVGVPDSFEREMRHIVEYSMVNGVIPILGTKADRREGMDNINNRILREIAADYHVPLWDFDAIAGTIPGRGLGNDGVHLTTFYAHDYTQPAAFTTGHGVHSLTALIMLDRIWQIVKD